MRLQTAIDRYLKEALGVPHDKRLATSSSFVQARAKVSHAAFVEVNALSVNYFYEKLNTAYYNGHRLVAIDGTVLTVPKTPDNIKVFGKNVLSTNAKWLKAQVSFATDVQNNICLDAQIGAYKESERDMAKEQINKLGQGNLFLFDRGYYSYDLLNTLDVTSNEYCFRVQKKANKEIIDFVNDPDRTDDIVFINDIKVRLTKVELDNGETEYLLSSLLDFEKYTKAELKQLYHLRWGIEEQYKDIKHAITIENFSGKSPEFIKQDFYAKILSYNLSMMLFKDNVERIANKPVKSKAKRKYRYKANKRAILSKFKETYIKLFLKAVSVMDVISDAVISIAKEAVPIITNRHYPRAITHKAKIKTSRAYITVT